MKELFPVNRLTKHATSSLIVDEVETPNDYDMANAFCSFFSAIANNLKLAAFPLIDFVWKHQFTIDNSTARGFNFKQVQVYEVFKSLKT